ncbi:MAG: GNAT family N-acetyltransferase [Flavobacteriales bacterium]
MKKYKTYLRTVSEQDVDLMMKWENNPEFWPHSASAGPFTRTEVLDFIRECTDLYRHLQCRYIIATDTDGDVGALDIFEYDEANKTAGMGIMIAEPANRRKGLARDAVLQFLALDETQRSLRLVWCLVDISNLPSQALFTHCGFAISGTKLYKGKEALRYTRYVK